MELIISHWIPILGLLFKNSLNFSVWLCIMLTWFKSQNCVVSKQSYTRIPFVMSHTVIILLFCASSFCSRRFCKLWVLIFLSFTNLACCIYIALMLLLSFSISWRLFHVEHRWLSHSFMWLCNVPSGRCDPQGCQLSSCQGTPGLFPICCCYK